MTRSSISSSQERIAGASGFVERLADEICARGLRLPALIALEAGRPFMFLGGQLLWMSQPFLGLFLPVDGIGRAARALEEPETVSALIKRLETGESR